MPAGCFVCDKHAQGDDVPGGIIYEDELVYGHHVAHLHVHVVARYPDAPQEYWASRVHEWPDAPRGGAEEMARVVSEVRRALN